MSGREHLVGTVRARAGGKVIVLGEHAVVYGSPALLGGVHAGLEAHIRGQSAREPSRLELGDLTAVAAADGELVEGRAWHALLRVGPAPGSLHARVSGSLPIGVGLGSSAAAGVALARAVERFVGARADERRVHERAMAWERVFHGNPSGADVAAAMRGGLLRFARPASIEAVAGPALLVCIGLSGVGSSTRDMVDGVAALRARERARIDQVMDTIGQVVEDGIAAVHRGDVARLGALLDRNAELLGELGLSTPTIDQLCDLARKQGARGAKLTGAGGGGAVIALAGAASPGQEPTAAGAVLKRAEAVMAAWRSAGYEAFLTRIGPAPPEAAGHQ